jgi:hypothetical protein
MSDLQGAAVRVALRETYSMPIFGGDHSATDRQCAHIAHDNK